MSETDEESRLRLLRLLEGRDPAVENVRSALALELLEKHRLLVSLGADGRSALDYLHGLGPRPPQDPDGSVRGDVHDRLRSLPPRMDGDMLSLRSVGPTRAAAYFRWKAEARKAMGPSFNIRRFEKDRALLAELFELSGLEVRLVQDVAHGAADPDSAARAERARDIYARLIAACLPP